MRTSGVHPKKERSVTASVTNEGSPKNPKGLSAKVEIPVSQETLVTCPRCGSDIGTIQNFDLLIELLFCDTCEVALGEKTPLTQ